MIPEYMGGFATSAGPEIINTWAVPIPILHEGMLENILKLDKEIPLKLVDLAGRIPLCEITYGDVWDNTDLTVKYESEKCMNCKRLSAYEKPVPWVPYTVQRRKRSCPQP